MLSIFAFLRTSSRPIRKYRLAFEQLESRVVPSVWIGGDAATPTIWSDPNNWMGHVLPTNGEVVRFDTTAATIGRFTSQNDIPNLALGGIVINDTDPVNGFNITGLPVSLTGGITSATAGPAQTVGFSAIQLGASMSWTNNLGALNVTSSIDLAGFSLTAAGAGNTVAGGTISSSVATGDSLIQNGTGSFTMAGTSTSTYTGTTTVSAGTLLIDGTLTGSPVSVAGGTLGGVGTIDGTVTAVTGTNVSPGDSATTTGALKVGSLQMTQGGAFNVALGGAGAGQFDQTVISPTGTVRFNGGGGIGNGMGGVALNISIVNGFTPTVGQQFKIIDNQGSSGVVGKFFGPINQGGTITISNTYIFAVSYTGGDGNDVVLTFNGFTVGAISRLVLAVASTSQTTGTPFQITVTATDQSGNTVSGYRGTISIDSTDPAAPVLVSSYTFVASDNGVHTFNVTLNTSTLAAGNPGATIFARDINATAPPIQGFLSPITVQGLVVPAGGFQPTATGFTVTFSKPFAPADLTMYAQNLTTVQDVTLVGANSGPVDGSLYLDPTSPNTIVFKASSAYLLALNAASGDTSAALPDDTYTTTLVSGSGTNGFVDALNTHLDGLGNGTAANYTATFATTFQDDAHANANPTPILAIPDFARGPDAVDTIQVPNKTAHGIPITLYNVTNSVADATFTLTYNPQILTPTAGGTGDAPVGSTFTMGTIASIDSTHSSVPFTYHNATGHAGTIVLGDVLATVPNSAATIYKTKELLALGNITITGGAAVQASDGIHVDAYLGDVHVTAFPTIDISDAVDAQRVSSGAATGFTPYGLLDPAIIAGFIADHIISVDTADTTNLFAKTAHAGVPQLPNIPATLTTVSVGGADPTVSLASAVQATNGIVSVAVMLDQPHPAGSTGMTEAHLALTYDPSVLSVSASGITLGSIPGLGWQITSEVDAASGLIGINMFNVAGTPITATQAGSLVNIAFHVVPGATVPWAAVQLVSQVTVNGQRILTEVDDSQGPLTLSPGIESSSAGSPDQDGTVTSADFPPEASPRPTG